MSQTVNVFCAASDGARPEFRELASDVGRMLAQRGLGIVYGGGGRGMMGALADGAISASGRVIGVIPEFMIEKERAHTGVAEMRVVQTMLERKKVMADLADGFLALPGGVGTLDELFEVITWRQLRLHDHPIVVLDAYGCFAGLRTWFERGVSDGFLPQKTVPAFCQTPEEALALLTA